MLQKNKVKYIPILVSGLIFLIGTVVTIIYSYYKISNIFATDNGIVGNEIMTVYLHVLIIVVVTILMSIIGYILIYKRLKRSTYYANRKF